MARFPAFSLSLCRWIHEIVSIFNLHFFHSVYPFFFHFNSLLCCHTVSISYFSWYGVAPVSSLSVSASVRANPDWTQQKRRDSKQQKIFISRRGWESSLISSFELRVNFQKNRLATTGVAVLARQLCDTFFFFSQLIPKKADNIESQERRAPYDFRSSFFMVFLSIHLCRLKATRSGPLYVDVWQSNFGSAHVD